MFFNLNKDMLNRNQEWYPQIHYFNDFETLNYESFKKVKLMICLAS